MNQEVRRMNTWFQDRAQTIWEEHVLPLKFEINTYLEIGVGDGSGSTLWCLENLDLNHAYLVDEWKAVSRRHEQSTYNVARDNALHNLKPHKNRVTVFEMSTREFFGACMKDGKSPGHDPEPSHWYIPDGSVDLLYVDANHRGDWALFDICNAYLKLRNGGVFVFDDLNRRFAHQVAQCRQAWLAFMTAYDGHYVPVFLGQRQFICRKAVPKRGG